MSEPLLIAQLRELAKADRHWLPLCANAAALLYHGLDGLNWAGFYFTRDHALVLGPFQGQPACVRIPWGKGVCGAAAEADRPLAVDDVHAFAGHIACDAASRSELVIPLHADGRVVGVLDLDSPLPARFGEEEQALVSAFAAALEELAVGW